MTFKRSLKLFAIAAAMATLAPGLARAQESGKAAGELLGQNIIADIAEKTLPSVVSVYVKADIRDRLKELQQGQEGEENKLFDDPDLKEFFEQRDKEKEGQEGDQKRPGRDPHKNMFETRTSGSGVIISEDGYVITNYHIVAEAKPGTISIQLNDDTEVPAEKVKLVAVDKLIDVAFLKVDPAGLTLKPLPWGDSSSTRIGEWVVAIGNPLDLRGSVSVGIISAKGRRIDKVQIEHLIQTDAMINPGNSGGALVNLKGELIGINMAIATNTGFFQGIGFAIPSKDAKFVADEVIANGRIRRGYIGIEMDQLDGEKREYFGLDGEGSHNHGILVTHAVPGAPADKAGIQAYDIIVDVDGEAIKEPRDLVAMIAGKTVGDDAKILILRPTGGKVKEMTVTMKVTERPTDEELNDMRDKLLAEQVEKEKPVSDLLGLVLKPFSRSGVSGMEIVSIAPKSAAAKSRRLAPGDVILEINQAKVATQSGYDRALDAVKEGQLMLFSLLRDGGHVFETLEKPADTK